MNSFSNSAVKGLVKVGNMYCPKNGEFPSFSEVAGTYKLNDLVKNVPSDDFSSLNLVLAIFAFLPNFMIKWVVDKCQQAQHHPSDGIITSTFRQLNIGLRGLCYSLYYSEFTHPDYKGKTPLQVMEYKLNRITD